MRITFLTMFASQNGGPRVVAVYAQKLVEMGHEVTVISRRPPRQSRLRRVVERLRGRQRRHDPNRTAYYDPLGERHVQIPWKCPVEAQDLPDADIVIATWWRTAFEVAALPPDKGRKVYFVQGHEVHEEMPWDLGAGSYYLPLKKIAVSQWLVDIMADRYGDRDVVKVNNSVDTAQFDAPPRTRNRRPVVGLMYSEASFKGIDIALEAIEIARRTHPDLEVLSFGTREPDAALPLPAGSRFHFSPAQDQIAGLYAACDLWLVASRAEGFGLPILEAMACRTPVIASRTGAATDVIEEGVNGHVVEVGDAAMLAARISDVLSLSPEAWQAMSAAAHARARGYSWDDAARDFEAALKDCLE